MVAHNRKSDLYKGQFKQSKTIFPIFCCRKWDVTVGTERLFYLVYLVHILDGCSENPAYRDLVRVLVFIRIKREIKANVNLRFSQSWALSKVCLITDTQRFTILWLQWRFTYVVLAISELSSPLRWVGQHHRLCFLKIL